MIASRYGILFGECETFPCQLLNQFARGEKQGDGGRRIEQRKLWKGAEQ